eukprot:scaffold10056_cov164-Amphora_coffeaeformis.AAC.14
MSKHTHHHPCAFRLPERVSKGRYCITRNMAEGFGPLDSKIQGQDASSISSRSTRCLMRLRKRKVWTHSQTYGVVWRSAGMRKIWKCLQERCKQWHKRSARGVGFEETWKSTVVSVYSHDFNPTCPIAPWQIISINDAEQSSRARSSNEASRAYAATVLAWFAALEI